MVARGLVELYATGRRSCDHWTAGQCLITCASRLWICHAYVMMFRCAIESEHSEVLWFDEDATKVLLCGRWKILIMGLWSCCFVEILLWMSMLLPASFVCHIFWDLKIAVKLQPSCTLCCTPSFESAIFPITFLRVEWGFFWCAQNVYWNPNTWESSIFTP